MIRSCFLLLFCAIILINKQVCAKARFSVEFQWQYINYTWPSPTDYNYAIKEKIYIPENNAMAGIKYYENKIYIAIPRIREGVPVTMGYIDVDHTSNTNLLIKPFPSWEFNSQSDCRNLQSVQSMEIDANGVMWIIDGMRTSNFSKGCPPKLVLFDINKNKVVETYEFDDSLCLSDGGFLNDIVVDDQNGEYAYITDNSVVDPGIIVYSRRQKRAWKLRDASMFAEVDALDFTVHDRVFTMMQPVDGIALSPKLQAGKRFLYYCSLTGFNLYQLMTDILKNEQKVKDGSWRACVKKVGAKQAQSDGMIADDKGNLYWGLLPIYGVGKWNIYEDFDKKTILDYNEKTMIWTDSFSIDDKGYLRLLCNNIDLFFDPTNKLEITEEYKFRIVKTFINANSYLY